MGGEEEGWREGRGSPPPPFQIPGSATAGHALSKNSTVSVNAVTASTPADDILQACQVTSSERVIWQAT